MKNKSPLAGFDEFAFLEKEFADLQKASGATFDQYQRSNEDLWRALVKTYLFWTRAKDAPGFLDKLYANIQYKKQVGDTPNFNPLLRVVFAKSSYTPAVASKIGLWAAALRALHVEYSDNTISYQANPEGKLLSHFRNNGGIDGLAKKDSEERQARDEEDSNEAIKLAPVPPNPFKERPIEEIRASALAKASAPTATGFGQFSTLPVMYVNDQDLVVLLARRSDDGKITPIASSHDDALLKQASDVAANYTLSHLPPRLQLLVEVIRSQLYPPSSLPKEYSDRRLWMRNIFSDKSKLTTKDLPGWTGKREPLISSKKLLMRGADADIILSGTKVSTSVVTRCVPTLKHFTHTAQISLTFKSLCLVERMIETREIHAIEVLEDTAETKKRIKNSPALETIGFLRKAQSDFRFFSFHDAKRDAGAPVGFQAYFDFGKWVPKWSFTVKPLWLAQMRERLWNPWFTVYGKGSQLNRMANRAMSFIVRADALEVLFDLSPRRGSPSETFKIDAVTTAKTNSHFFRSKDVAPVFYNLADTQVLGDVEISGNKDAMVIAYTTAMGCYQTAIPTAKSDGGEFALNISKAFTELHYG